MHITEEQAGLLAPGQPIVVEVDDRRTPGRFVGLTRDVDGPKLRLLAPDRIEYRFPLPAKASVADGA